MNASGDFPRRSLRDTSHEVTSESSPADFKPRIFPFAVAASLAAYVLAGLLPLEASASRAQSAAAITAFVAVSWLSSMIPLGAASLLPLALMPLFGVLPIDQASAAYAHPVIWMFFGGFILALGIERWELHRRIALTIITRLGTNPSRLILGFGVAAATLSMWLNNTSTTLLLLPIATALIDSIEKASTERSANFAFALLVMIAYACSIGGVGTPIGTAPNAIFLSNYASYEAAGAPPMNFALWMATGLPVVAAMVLMIWWVLTRVLAPVGPIDPKAQNVLDNEARKLPAMSVPERRMGWVFLLAALLWSTRRDIDLGTVGVLPGWWRLFPVEQAQAIGDAAAAAFVCVLAFFIPAGGGHRGALMTWETAKRMPWEILFLVGGGIAIAQSFAETGLALALGTIIQPLLGQMGPIGMILTVCIAMTFLTEITSNTAMTALLLPVLSGTAVAIDVDPRLLLIPATFSASCAFMLPVATPPNAIVFASGRIPMARMARAGFVINLVGIALVTVIVYFITVPTMGITVGRAEDWAHRVGSSETAEPP